MKRFLPLLAILATLTLGGCAWSIGGGPEEETHFRNPTLAEELEDLKEAHEEGRLTDDEYGEAKAALLRR